MHESYRFLVTGRVQGVGFRVSAQRKALVLGLHGWVRNCADGAVEGAVSGDIPADLMLFRDWLWVGPAGSRVDSLDWSEIRDAVDESSFVIRR